MDTMVKAGKSPSGTVSPIFIQGRYPVSDLYGFDIGHYDDFGSLWRALYGRFDQLFIDR